MKRFLLMLILAMLLPVATWARGGDDIVNEFRDAKHAQYVNVGPGMLRLAQLFTPGVPNASHGLRSVRVLDLTDCKDGVRERFHQRVQNLRYDTGYEEMVTSEGDKDNSMVLLHSDGTYADELVVVQDGDGGSAIVVIRGRIPLDDVERIARDDSYYPIR